MKIVPYIFLLFLFVSCGDDDVAAPAAQTTTTTEDTTPTFDLALTKGATTLGAGPNYSTGQAVLDCKASFVSKLMNLNNKIAFGVNSTVSCGACDVTVTCTAGETVTVESRIWDGDAQTAGGQVGLTSGACNSQGKFVASDKYTGGYPLRITATMGTSTDVEYVECTDPG